MKRQWTIIGMIVALLVILMIGTAGAESGTMCGLYCEYEDGILTLGDGTDDQHCDSLPSVDANSYPWRNFRESITEVKCNGTIYWSGSMAYMFSNCPNLVSCELGGFDMTDVVNISRMFSGCTSLEYLDVSTWAFSHLDRYNSTDYVLNNCTSLKRVKFGAVNPFYRGYSSTYLPEYVYVNGKQCYGKWQHIDGTYGPFTPTEWNTNYTAEMAGEWVFVPNSIIAYVVYVPSEYKIYYIVSADAEAAYSDGQMNTITSVSGDAYTGVTYAIDGEHFTWGSINSGANEVIVVDEIAPASMASWFSNCVNCTSFDLDKIDFSTVTSMYHTFYNCRSLPDLDVSDWDTSKVTTMQGMFQNCATTSLDLSELNVSNVRNMSSMFDNSQIGTLTLTGWDVRKVTDADRMFNNYQGHLIAADFNWSSWSDSQTYMFQGGSSTTVLDIPRWSFCQPNMDFTYMFYGSYATVNAPDWNLDGVRVIGKAFRNCYCNANIPGWHSNTVLDTSSMFTYFTGTHIDVTGWRMPALENVYEMFGWCGNLTTIDGLETWDVSSIKNMSWLFGHDPKLVNFDVSTWVTSSVEDTRYMFGSTPVVELDLSNFDMSHVTRLGDMFNSCSQLRVLNVAGWNLSNAGSLSGLFNQCPQLESIDLSNWTTTGVTNMSALFSGCSRLVTLDLSSFDTADVTNMGSMFSNCYQLQVLNMENFDMSNVTDKSNMFQGCNILQDVTLSPKHVFGSNYNDRLPNVPTSYGGVEYTGNWIRDDATAGPISAYAMSYSYVPGMAGRWVWEKSVANYFIHFVCDLDTYVGSMPDAVSLMGEDFWIPYNGFAAPGYTFVHWVDEDGTVWENHDKIPAYTYSAYIDNGLVTLTAVFEPRDTSVAMEDGAFEISVPTGSKAILKPIPSGTEYQVFEYSSAGWVLVEQRDSAGMITSLEESSALFGNSRQSGYTTVQFVGQKLLDSAPAEAGSFQFELWEGYNLLETVTVGEGGFVEFTPIVYTWSDVGTHTYTIKEVVLETTNVYSYDTHEETVTVNVHPVGDTIVSHTDNIDDDGNQLSDYTGYTYYTDIISLPDVESIHVQLRYTNARGQFYVWPKAYEAVHTHYYDNNFNPGMAVKYYQSQSGKDYEYLTDEFDIDTNALSILYYSSTYTPRVPDEPEIANYGYYMKVSSSELTADVTYDADGIMFNNSEFPGRLTLAKRLTEDKEVLGSFGYEIELFDESGQAYELPNGTLWYEVREGDRTDYADLLTENERLYRMTVINKILHLDGSQTTAYDVHEYNMDDTVIVNKLDLSGYYLKSISRNDLITTDTGWEGIMPRHNDSVVVWYYPLKTLEGSIVWDDEGNIERLRPDSVTVHLVKNGTVLESQEVSEPWTFSFVDYPEYENNQWIDYEFTIDDIDGYTIVTDGSTLTGCHYRSMARISRSLWSSYVNTTTSNSSTTPLTDVTEFVRNTTYTSEAELPEGAKDVSDDGYHYPIYVWKDGTTMYWWSEAETVYFPADSSYFFKRANALTSLDLSEFDFSQVASMNSMFWSSANLESITFGENCDTHNVTNMGSTFSTCRKLTTVDFEHLNTHRVTTFYSMFSNCNALSDIDPDDFDTYSMQSLGYMFNNCTSLTELDLSGWNTSRVTSMSSMFYGCSNLQSLNLNGLSTAGLTTVSSMFAYCPNLTTLNIVGFNFGTKVTSYSSLFYGDSSLTTLDLSGWNSTTVKYMNSMFYNCSNLTTIYVGDNWSTDAVTSSGSMFTGCASIVGGANTPFDSTHTDKTYACVDNPPDVPGYFTYKAVP